MNTLELAKQRRSVRTFDGNPLTPQDREKIENFIKSVQNPFGQSVEFILLDAKENGLSKIEGLAKCLAFGFTWWLPLKKRSAS